MAVDREIWAGTRVGWVCYKMLMDETTVEYELEPVINYYKGSHRIMVAGKPCDCEQFKLVEAH